MKKTKKSNKPQGQKSGHPNLKETAYHHWRQNGPPVAGDPIEVEAGREYMEEEEKGEKWEGEERRWERDARDDEPGELS